MLVDVRQPAELRRGRVHGSVNIPIGQLRDRLQELHRDRTVAFPRQSGAPSSRATGIALKAGCDTVSVKGGVIALNRAGLPVTR
jgi:rhodanese-related sulfurtransferase